MIRWRAGTITSVQDDGPHACSLRVDTAEGEVPALAYLPLTGRPRVGERVLLNTNALALGLGTGGVAMLVARPDDLAADPPASGHLVKARYTPLQVTVGGVDEQGSPHHDTVAGASSLDGMPVVVADLHSALAPIVAGVRADRPDARIAYVMTDGAALPLWFSHTVTGLAPLLAGTVTTGQAFGGDLEAVSVHTGLLAARHVLNADVTVVTQGPGNLGTGTPWGFSGVAAGDALNAVSVLGGRPVGALRVSTADPRPRHRGVSHHSLTAFGRVALVPTDLPVPSSLADTLAPDLAELPGRLTVVRIAEEGLEQALRALPVAVSTMGRGLDDDGAYFLTNAAAGRHAAALLPR